MKKIFLTTPLYYVNAKPHIGHAYTNVLVDTFSRYYRWSQQPVYFLTGTDEHGTKIEKIAREQNQTPVEYANSIAPLFKGLWDQMGMKYDDFIRTTEERHKRIVKKILTDLEAKGDIYRSRYEGWYCTPCESFWTDLQLKEGKCPDCQREVQRLTEDNYFFKLAKYQDWLIEHIHNHPDFIFPDSRRNEILGFLKNPLEDLCITRPRARLTWGIDYPSSPDHVVYVWFDALINYISAVGYLENDELFKSTWPADIHFVGKDILRQHAVYWPIMLRAIGLEMPRRVAAHGWWTLGGAKVSKSRGNAVDPIELSNQYGVDAFRYFLLKEVTLGADGAFSEDLFRERYTTDLANDLGNLWFRLASMMDKYTLGVIPTLQPETRELPIYQNALKVGAEVCESMNQLDPRGALGAIFAVVVSANKFIEEQKPWTLAKDPAKKDQLLQVLSVLSEVVAHIGLCLVPFLPITSSEILQRLGLDPETIYYKDAVRDLLSPNQKMTRGAILFPKLEDEVDPSKKN